MGRRTSFRDGTASSGSNEAPWPPVLPMPSQPIPACQAPATSTGPARSPCTREGRGIELANRAFCLCDHGVRNVQASRGDENHKELWGALSRCATNRRVGGLDFRSDLLGRKVLSLQAVFQHLEENDGRWTDENTPNYSEKAGRGFTSKVP